MQQNAVLTPTKRKAIWCKTQNKMVLFTNFGRPYQLTNGKKIGLFEVKNHLK